MTSAIAEVDVPGARSTSGAASGFIFISYKREEWAYAAQLRMFLRLCGFRVRWDRQLQTGRAWAPELDRRLLHAGCVIVLWSRRAALSPWVRHEASAAMGRGVYLPVIIEEVTVPDPFARIQAAELIGWDGRADHPGFKSLLDSLERILKQSAGSYELEPAKRKPGWPNRVPRSVVARAWRWTRGNFATLVAATALLTLAYLVVATERSVHELDGQVHTVGSAVSVLRSGVGTIERSSTEIRVLMRESIDKQKAIVGQLGEQQDAGLETLEALERVANVIEDNASTTNSLLDETLKRTDVVDLGVEIHVDPASLQDADGSLLDENLGYAVKHLSLQRPADLQPTVSQIENMVLSRLRPVRPALEKLLLGTWELSIGVETSVDRAPPGVRINGQERSPEFAVKNMIVGASGGRVVCVVKYQVPLVDIWPRRHFGKLPGTKIYVEIRANERLLEAKTFTVRLGMEDDLLRPEAIQFTRAWGTVPSWTGVWTVPSDYLSTAKGTAPPPRQAVTTEN